LNQDYDFGTIVEIRWETVSNRAWICPQSVLCLSS